MKPLKKEETEKGSVFWGRASHEGISEAEECKGLPYRFPVNSPLENITLSGLWT
jgi:hypothetical protein